MATIQVRVDDSTKSAVDSLFTSMGLDTSTAVRMFFTASLAKDGLPFQAKRPRIKPDLLEAMEDVRLGRNLHGPYDTVEEAMAAMLED